MREGIRDRNVAVLALLVGYETNVAMATWLICEESRYNALKYMSLRLAHVHYHEFIMLDLVRPSGELKRDG